MRRKAWRLSIGIAVLLWTARTAWAQPPGELIGSVKDSTGLPLTNVTITIHGPADAIAQTGAEGQFGFESLPHGDYELTAALAGFAPAYRVFRITSGERITLSLTLTVSILEQVVVTAAKAGEADVQTTPMAVTVLSGTELERLEAHDVEHIAGLAPSVTFSQNTGFAQLTIRGIGTNAVFAGSDPSSAVYVDGVYLARPAMVLAQFLDLERVEVLRGPQGTLYGRNAVGGAVNLITKPPTNDVDASVRISVGDYDMLRSEARLSGPIVPDKVIAGGAILRGVRSGYVQDLNHPDHPLGGEDVTAARGQLRVVFNTRTDLLVSADLSHQDPIPLTYAKVLAVKPGFQIDNPTDLHDVRTSTLAESRNVQYGASARFTMSLTPATTLTSLSAFRTLDYDVLTDADITELDLVTSHSHETQHQVSEELTVAHRQPRLTWVGGVFLFNELDRQPIVVGLDGPRLQNLLNPRVDANAGAVYGQATVNVVPRVSVTAGLRYSDERKTIENAGQISTLDPPMSIVPGSAYAYTDAVSYSAWTPKLGMEFQALHNAVAYLSATRGFKSGGFNLTSQEPGRGYAPEWAWSYEGGLKTTVAGGRANLNASVFQTDYTNLQVQTPIAPGVLDISNAAAATIRGVELEATTRLTRVLRVGGHVAWLDARYDRYVAVGPGGITGNVAGHFLSNAPEWSGRLWLEWNADTRRVGVLSLRVDATWQTTVFFTPFNDLVQQQRPYGLLNITGEFGPKRRHWTVALFARNLTNTDYITGTFSTPPPAIGGRPGDPRQVGVQLVIRR